MISGQNAVDIQLLHIAGIRNLDQSFSCGDGDFFPGLFPPAAHMQFGLILVLQRKWRHVKRFHGDGCRMERPADAGNFKRGSIPDAERKAALLCRADRSLVFIQITALSDVKGSG